jgi:long-chain acyl-CoA synthetase
MRTSTRHGEDLAEAVPGGRAGEMKTDLYPSLVALLEESFASTATCRPTSSWARPSPSAQVDDLSRAFAAWLQSQGLAPATAWR